MNMTTNEIVRSYNEAKDKNNQITVLADMNVTDRKSIIAVLEAAGVLEPIKKTNRGKKGAVTGDVKPEDAIMLESICRSLQYRLWAIIKEEKEIHSKMEEMEQQLKKNNTEAAFIRTYLDSKGVGVENE